LTAWQPPDHDHGDEGAQAVNEPQDFRNHPGRSTPSVAEAISDRLGALMQAGQAGNAAAYRTLLDEVARLMRRRVRRRAPYLSAEDVEDLVQDVLLSLHLARASYDPTRPFLPWIVTITRNRIADHARRFGRRAAIDLEFGAQAETFDASEANTHADKVVDFLSVREALTGLSPSEREAVRLLRLRQLTLAEASAESGSSVAALKVAMHRATKRLRSLLKGSDDADR